jgi:hypothetical protein
MHAIDVSAFIARAIARRLSFIGRRHFLVVRRQLLRDEAEGLDLLDAGEPQRSPARSRARDQRHRLRQAASGSPTSVKVQLAVLRQLGPTVLASASTSAVEERPALADHHRRR